jgi:hypothetical protein
MTASGCSAGARDDSDASEGGATILFFDDFEDGTGKWDPRLRNGTAGVTSDEAYGGTQSYRWWCPSASGECRGITSSDSFSSDVGIVLQAKGMISNVEADSVVEGHLRKASDDSTALWAEVSIDGPTRGNDRFGQIGHDAGAGLRRNSCKLF